MNNGNKAAHDRAWSHCMWFIRKGRVWTKHTERIEEVCWSEEEMRLALSQAGFGAIRSRDSTLFLKGSPIIKRGCRTHYLARKEMPKTGS